MPSPTSHKLQGVNSLGEPVQLGSEVVKFVDEKRNFTVNRIGTLQVEVITKQGVYHLKKHATQNTYMGVCGKTKVHVSLKQVVGTIRYW